MAAAIDDVRLVPWAGDLLSLADLTALLRRAYAQHAAEGRRFFASYQSEADTADRIRGAECWLAIIGQKVVGTVTVSPPGRAKGEHYEQPGTGTFSQLAVEPELKGAGLGDLLLRTAESRLAALGAERVVIDTSEHARDLLAWYERRGYQRIGQADWPVTNYISVVLAKSLSNHELRATTHLEQANGSKSPPSKSGRSQGPEPTSLRHG